MDLGCGAGRDSCFLALRGWDVLAVDNMPKALDRARLLADKCDLPSATLDDDDENNDKNNDDENDDNSDSGSGSGSSSSSRSSGGRVTTAVVDVRKHPDTLRRRTAQFTARRGVVGKGGGRRKRWYHPRIDHCAVGVG